MPKKTVIIKSSLINRNSFFDIWISCRSAFDRKIVAQIERGSLGDAPQPFIALQNISKLFENEKDLDILEKTKMYRNSFFYLILMMDYMTDQLQNLMILQMMAMDLCVEYCKNLDKLIKTDFHFVQEEMDKCITFQTSTNCVTPNIIKENFLEMLKNKDLLNLTESQFIDVDFDEPDDNQVLATDEEILNNINEMMSKMNIPKKKTMQKKLTVKKPKN
jgi:hypothetical protein